MQLGGAKLAVRNSARADGPSEVLDRLPADTVGFSRDDECALHQAAADVRKEHDDGQCNQRQQAVGR